MINVTNNILCLFGGGCLLPVPMLLISEHLTFTQRHINVDVHATLYKRHVPTGCMLHDICGCYISRGTATARCLSGYLHWLSADSEVNYRNRCLLVRREALIFQ